MIAVARQGTGCADRRGGHQAVRLRRARAACVWPKKASRDLAGTVDTVIAIPNDRLLKLAPKGTSFFDAFKMADDLLRQAVQGISDIIITPGLINRDFSDIKATMIGMGYAMMGTATARAKTRPSKRRGRRSVARCWKTRASPGRAAS